MALYQVGDKVIYRQQDGAVTKTGVIKRLRFEGNRQLYEIKPDDSANDVLVPEGNIVEVV